MPDSSSAHPPESYGRIMARPALVLATLLALAAWQFRPRPEAPTPAPPRPVAVAKVVEPEPAPPPPPAPARRPKREPRPAPPPIELDHAAVARSEAALDQAARERARADARLAEAEKALQAATIQTAKDRAESRSLVSKVRDPSARIASITSKGGFLKGERDKLKSDARIRLRSGTVRGRLAATVGPVGSFSLSYVLGRLLPDSIADIVDNRDAGSYNLLGWEIIPEGNNRGEAFEATRSPSSNYARAINRLSPGRDTVTMWIYPDAFPLYRKLRDDLHARGFLVAARPLPDGTAIRGSPVGSVSAGQ
jgi:hypothetical protein